MNLEELLEKLGTANVRLWVEDGQLRIRIPKGGMTPDVRAALTQHKTALIDLYRRQQLAAAEDAPPQVAPDPDNRYQPFPLTDIQQAYWIGRKDAFELGAVTCHLYMEIESNHVEPEGLERAWQKLCVRHDMLRAIVLEDGTQVILEKTPAYQIQVTDLRGLADSDAAAKLASIRETMSHQLIPADRWPLFDIRVTRHGNNLRRIHLSIDLLMVDVGSILQLFDEWQRLYRDPQLHLQGFQFSFRDYVLAEHAREQSPTFESDWAYWSQRAKTLPPGPKLPLRIAPNSLKVIQFHRRHFQLPADVWQGLKERARQFGLTASGLLLTCFSEILAAWSQNQHFTINLTLFNRLPFHPEVDSLVGDFTTLTLLEIDRRQSATFLQQAEAIARRLWQDLEHRSVSGVKVLREMSRQQGGHTVLMPVVFTSALALNASNRPVAGLADFGDRIYTATQTPQVWLDHQVFEEQGGLSLSWDTVDALFPENLIDSMFSAYTERILSLQDEAVWKSPSVAHIPRAQWEQRQNVNATQRDFPDLELTYGLRKFAIETPDAMAVESAARSLTYRELWSEANALAYQLRQHEVQPDQLVAVIMEKGWEQVVAVYAVLLAGGAYLPLDPDQPSARLRTVLQDACVTVVLIQPRWRRSLDLEPSYLVFPVEERQAPHREPLPLVHQPHHLAYVIYTSGSTGQPKGVVIDHRGAVNTLHDINERFQVTSEDRALSLSALNFDLSVYDIFGLHFAGGAAVLPSDAQKREPSAWVDLVKRFKVSIWNSVPALKQMFAEHLQGGKAHLPPSLRLVMMSGDWIPVHLPGLIRQLASKPLRIISLGGATEASIWSIFFEINQVDPEWKSIPYGKPMWNQSFHVLDDSYHPRPQGVTGELFIGGVGVAKGYWGDPEKTQARFVTNPHTGERLYRTGDLGRYLEDGNIEFLGRMDSQVKIGGYRIELGEIEAVLNGLPDVKDGVVIAFGPHTHRQLAAYVVPAEKGHVGNGLQATDLESRPVKAQNFLQDPHLRGRFKFEQRGLRSLPAETPAVVLASAPQEDRGLTYFQRQSLRGFNQEPLSLDALSGLLECLRALRVEGSPIAKYRYGSAGHLYPVQTYLYLKQEAVLGMEGGFYYYHPEKHQLLRTNPFRELTPDIHQTVNQTAFQDSGFSLFLVGKMEAVQPVYGPLARDFCLIEAGYMGQLLMSQAPEFEVGLCPIGVVRFEDLRQPFGLPDADQTCLLHSFVGGKVASASYQTWTMPAAPVKTASPVVQIKQALGERLPVYMIPQHIQLLDALPLSENGKVDRKQLPLPGEVVIAKQFRQPESETARALADIWKTVLGKERIGLDDDFFELGGHSLLATRTVSRIRDTFNLELHLRTFFLNSKLDSLSQVIDQAREGSSRVHPLTRQEFTGNAPLSYAQQRLFFMDYLNPESPQFNMSYAIELRGPLDQARLEAGFQTVVERHEPLRTNYRLEQNGPVQIVKDACQFCMDFQDLSTGPEEGREAAMRRAFADLAQRTFHLERDALFRLHLMRLAPQHHVLLISVHHLNSDGWSVGVILRELSALYAGASPETLPEIAVRYRDFAACQRQWFESGSMEYLDAFWKPTLENHQELLLPTGTAHPEFKPHEGAFVTTRLTADQVSTLEKLASNNEATSFMVLLAMFKTFLYLETGQRDLLLGTDAANRNRTELEGLVGFFINILALRTSIEGAPSFSQFLNQVRQTVIDAYAHEDMPYDRLVKILDLERDLSGAPLIRALFVHQNFPLSGMTLQNLKWRLLEEEVSHARFDLAVFASGSDFLGDEAENILELKFLYRKNQYEHNEVVGMAERFRYLICQILANPALPLSAYSTEDPETVALGIRKAQENLTRKSQKLKGARRRQTQSLEIVAAQVNREVEGE